MIGSYHSIKNWLVFLGSLTFVKRLCPLYLSVSRAVKSFAARVRLTGAARILRWLLPRAGDKSRWTLILAKPCQGVQRLLSPTLVQGVT